MRKTRILLTLILMSPLLLNAQTRNLNYYLDQAKRNSPLIHKSRNESLLLDLDLKQVRAVLRQPEISIESNVLLAPIISHDNNSSHLQLISNGSENYNGYDLSSTDGGQYQAGISIKQPINSRFKIQSYSKNTDINKRINENNIDLTIHELEFLIGSQYLLCLKAKQQVQNSLALENQIGEQVSVMQHLVETAVYKQSNLMLLQIEQSNFEADRKMFQSEYKNDLYDLNLLCGIQDTSNVDIQDVSLVLESNMKGEQKFLKSYRLDSLNILSEQQIYNLRYKPQFYFYANAGLNAVYQPSFDRLGFSAGLSLSWTIFDGHQSRLQERKTEVNLNTIEFEKNNVISHADIRKCKIMAQIESLEQRVNVISQQLEKYDILVDTYNNELSIGEMSIMDLKNLLRDVAVKRNEMVTFTMERQALINTYNYWNY
ncbi:TolC family protein [Labilibaculum sp. K2S]|uniref:TolC family protein n=1 Tax=Labilibaculum sp. K2S TaxID=3056386 RepID=UPI0025A41AEB|nr:TolC family protein [Labilibaculum sp. K2S]MDM8160078.1 TolC family protein [Labilibaculum sp. K2S]